MNYQRFWARRGRPPSAYREEIRQSLLRSIEEYIKSHWKGWAAPLKKVAEALHADPETIKEVLPKVRGKWINGAIQVFEASGRIIIGWGYVGEDPLLCIHGDYYDATIILIKPGQTEVTCPTCGTTFLLVEDRCMCGKPLRRDGDHFYCDACRKVYVYDNGALKAVIPTFEESLDFAFRSLGWRSPREAFRETLSDLWPNRPPLPCEIIKSIRNVVATSLPPHAVRIEDEYLAES
ncbi:MAG: hypothetical protein ACP5QI_03325 [Candidatus Bathyarchaeia archaeon]